MKRAFLFGLGSALALGVNRLANGTPDRRPKGPPYFVTNKGASARPGVAGHCRLAGRSGRQGPQMATKSFWIAALSLFRRLEQLQRPGIRFGDDMSDITSTPQNWNAAASVSYCQATGAIFFAPSLGILAMLYYILLGRF